MCAYTMIPHEERPRTRLRETGEGSLGVADLIMLVTGNETVEAQGRVLRALNSGNNLAEIVKWDIPTIRERLGFTVLEATRLRGAFDLGRRAVLAMAEARLKIRQPADAAHLFRLVMGNPEQEELWVMLMNSRNEVIATRRVYIGTTGAISVRIGDIMKMAVREGAMNMVVCHNHPSGDPSPSADDLHTTRMLIKAGKILEIEVQDHVVLGDGRFRSIREMNPDMWIGVTA